MIASGAYKIIEARKAGYRPANMVIVSLIGKLNELNYTVYVDERFEYQWDWCKGLQIAVFAKQGVDWLKTIDDISKANPALLALWDADRHEGAEFFRSLNWRRSDALLMHSDTVLDYIQWCPLTNKIFNGELCN